MDEGPRKGCPACGALLPLEAMRCEPCRLDLDPASPAYKRRMALIERMVRDREEFSRPRPFLLLLLDLLWRPWTVFDRLAYQATEPTMIAGAVILYLIGCAVPVWADALDRWRMDWMDTLYGLAAASGGIALLLAAGAWGVRGVANFFGGSAEYVPILISLLLIAGLIGSASGLAYPLRALGTRDVDALYFLLALWALILTVTAVSRVCDVNPAAAIGAVFLGTVLLCLLSNAATVIVHRLIR